MMPSVKSVFNLYRGALSDAKVRRLASKHGFPADAPKYPPCLLFWLMIFQRVTAPGTLEEAVDSVRQGKWRRLQPRRGRGQHAPRGKLADVSLHTGGYCRARQRVPVGMIREMSQELTAALRVHLRGAELGPPVYIVDGSSLQLQAERELLDSYPPARNQHGRSHWPVMRIVVLHDARTGLALPPVWAPMSGPKAQGEQALAEQLMNRIPSGSVLLGDRNFGIFATAFAAHRWGLGVVLRLTKARARALGGSALRDGTVKELLWWPSRWDRDHHPDLPADACVPGRFIVCSAPGWRDSVYLFTTAPGSVEEVLALYRLRWNVETDLRSLKQTVRLHRLSSKSKAVVEKEIWAAIAAYNLVRTIIARAAEYAGIDPRRLSFTRILNLVNGALPVLLSCSPQKANREMQKLILLAADCTLPQRRHKRSYPRACWRPGYRYPARHESTAKIGK